LIIHGMDQGSVDWTEIRRGIPTASEFSKLVTSKGERSKSLDDYAAVLAADLYADKSLDRFEGNKYTDRGTELEPDAATMYEFLTDRELETVGFITNDEGTYGCSPDRLISEDGLVEFKCQIAKEHVKTLLYYKKHGKCPTTYIQQTQGQMMITGRAYCDLAFYHPDLPMLIIRQEPIPAVFRGLKEQLQAVIEERDAILETIKTFG